jgi:glycosyltransferase 2 family protein
MQIQKVLKLLISLALFSGLFYFIDLHSLIDTIKRFPVLLIIVVFMGYVFGQTLSCLKWWTILRASGLSPSFFLVLRAYYVGMFANILGFGTVGGDLTRALIVAAGSQARTRVLGTVAADRAHGLAVLALIGCIATLLFPHHSLPTALTLVLIVLAASVVVGWVVLVFGVQRFQRPEWFPASLHKLVRETASSLPQRPWVILRITLISVCFHLTQITLQWTLIRTLNPSVSYLFVLTVVPYINIISTLPLSWQGLGVRENAYIFFFVPLVLTTEEAIAVGTIWFLAVTVAAALGGLCSLITNDWRVFLKKTDSSTQASVAI